VEGALYPSIFVLEIETDVMPTPQGWQGNYAYLLVGVRTLSLLRREHKNPPIHMPHDLHRLGS